MEDFANLEGLGVQGIVSGDGTSHAVLVGWSQLLADWSQHLPPELEDALSAAQASGGTAVAVGLDGTARGVVVLADAVKPTSAEAIAQFRALGLRPILLTGDNSAVARFPPRDDVHQRSVHLSTSSAAFLARLRSRA